MNTPSPVDIAFNKFLHTVEERRSREQRRKNTINEIVESKDRELIPMRQLLKRMVDMNLVVTNASLHAGGIIPTNIAPATFMVHEGTSSPRWRPGNSLYIEHPAELEISIPNAKDRDEVGVVVIRSSTPHPDEPLLRGPFRTMTEACEALAEFVARNTEHINSPEFNDE